MPGPLNTTLDVLLNLAKTKLINDAVFTPRNCFIVVNNDINVFPPGTYCTISPGLQIPDQPMRAGAGRNCMLMNADVFTTIWTNINLDQKPRDDVILTDMSIGMIQLNNNLINSLELYQPVDSNGNWYSPIGFELKEIETQYKTTSTGVKGNEMDQIGWCKIKSRFTIEFTLNIASTPTS